MNGLDVKIDNLGRIVIPAKYRKALRITKDTVLKISLDDGTILLTPEKKCCLICGEVDHLNSAFSLCTSCINKIKCEI